MGGYAGHGRPAGGQEDAACRRILCVRAPLRGTARMRRSFYTASRTPSSPSGSRTHWREVSISLDGDVPVGLFVGQRVRARQRTKSLERLAGRALVKPVNCALRLRRDGNPAAVEEPRRHGAYVSIGRVRSGVFLRDGCSRPRVDVLIPERNALSDEGGWLSDGGRHGRDRRRRRRYDPDHDFPAATSTRQGPDRGSACEERNSGGACEGAAHSRRLARRAAATGRSSGRRRGRVRGRRRSRVCQGRWCW
jgi:hypothetical protein